MTNPYLAKQKNKRNRTYTHPGHPDLEYPSVTTILKCLNTGDGLMYWAVNSVTDYAINNWDDLTPHTKKMKRELIKKYRPDAEGTTMQPPLAGTAVHDLIESYIESGSPTFSWSVLRDLEKAEVDPDEALEQLMPRFLQFLAWEQRFKPKWLYSEATIFNKTVGYAGTLDAVAEIAGRTYMIDFKAAKGIYPNYSLQLHALAHGEEVVYPDGRVEKFKRPDTLSLLHITPREANWQQVHYDPRTFETFKSLVEVEKWWIERYHLQFGKVDVSKHED